VLAPVLFADFDLTILMHNILTLLPVTITGEWVQGHYSSKAPEKSNIK
jgi:hypothetical protein